MPTRLLPAGLCLAATLAASTAFAAPITYTGTLTATPQVDDIPIFGDWYSSSSDLSDYWQFFGTAGDIVTITARRLEGAFDVSFWLFEGLFTDDAEFNGGDEVELDEADPGYIGFLDDQLAPFIPGPYGDPTITLALPSTGFYTVIVTNYLSDADDGDEVFPYSIKVSPIPVPATLPLLVGGLGLIGWIARRKHSKI